MRVYLHVLDSITCSHARMLASIALCSTATGTYWLLTAVSWRFSSCHSAPPVRRRPAPLALGAGFWPLTPASAQPLYASCSPLNSHTIQHRSHTLRIPNPNISTRTLKPAIPNTGPTASIPDSASLGLDHYIICIVASLPPSPPCLLLESPASLRWCKPCRGT